jgi:hypothetical protein
MECGLDLQAQTHLTGKVVDKENRALSGVRVDFSNGRTKTATDGEGKFTISYPDTLQNRRLSLQLSGYKTKNVTVNKGQESLRIVLLDSIYQLGGVTVSAPRDGRFSDYSAQTTRMTTFDVTTNPAALADIIGGMRALPGVQTNDNDGRLIIQGGSSDESQVYMNDLIVANPYTLTARNSGVRNRFSPDLFSGTVLQSGGFNAEFGQALSGVVNLNTKERDEMEAKTDVSVSSIFADVTHIAKKPSYAYRANLSYSNLALTNTVTGSEYEWKKPYQSIFSDIFLIKEFSPATKITAQFNGSYSAGTYSGKNIDGVELENRFKQTYLYGQLNFYHTFNPKFSLSAASNIMIDKLSASGLQYSDDKSVTENVWNHNKITLQYKSGRITNRSGVEWIGNPYTETYSFITDYLQKMSNNLASVFNDTKLFLSNNLTANVGLRGEYSVYLKKTNLAPRLYLAYQPAAGNIFSVALGDYFQLPTRDYLKIADNLDFASVRKISAAYSYVKNTGKLQLDAYYKRYRNLVTYSQEAIYNYSGNGYGYGADVFWKSNFKTLEYWLTYSYNHTRKKYDDFPKAVAPPYVAAHALNLVLKYWAAPLKSMLSVSPFVSSGSPYYSPVFPHEKLGVTPYRSRLDVSWSYLPKQWIIVHFGCQNVLGRKNIYGYEYSAANPGLRREITASTDRFLFLGVFITISQSKKLNQLKSL